MEANTKRILIISGVVLLLGGIGVGLYFLLKDDKPSDEEGNENQDNESESNDNTGGSDKSSGNSNTTTTPPKVVDPTMVVPKYSVENELSNNIGQLKGKMLYPKRKEIGGWGYTNVRATTEVNDSTNWFYDPISNLLTTINSGTPIGTVVSEKSGVYNGYSYRWFLVKLYKPVGWFDKVTAGYVRADTVTFKAYKK
ncbi:MAG: hypothetical protein A3D31_11305 [Candidatus Fluviicola riflensis]|nr:MAG: hypothetical protein CHH17_15730 [Candidatus Fluviicola riflensis]OGS77576.1 MAG: hypothetical protein A3D31_11305 [Candidatus Fluviicola riflensis]OGS84157.1 MAG: hypothetical protein A3E30_12705 [Fluviicola sp. RIFCSPHIGHO2_12_FULL_43_24]OGS84642.1 MAG: hypothetical protein A2724_08240 [Fluviicola sp. RIFCSPHIGHO2_01_FULL_43_53]